MRRRNVLPLVICLIVMTEADCRPAPLQGKQETRNQNSARPQRGPDLQLMDFQFLEAAAGTLPSAMVRATVRNNTRDRTITGILFRLEVYDPARGSKVEEILPFVRVDAIKLGVVMRITAGRTVDVAFYTQRKVATGPDRLVGLHIQNYVYKSYDAEQDKPAAIEQYAAEEWPFESKTEPVLEKTAK